MSETQLKVTDTFKMVDENGEEYVVDEYTLFRHTTTSDMEDGVGAATKEYRLGNGALVRQINETEFELVSDGTRFRKAS
jgi:hypothetical protein